MNNNIYSSAIGFVSSYKSQYEPLLFNELNSAFSDIKFLDRCSNAAAFSCNDYSEIISRASSLDFVFLHHIHPFSFSRQIKSDITDLQMFSDLLSKSLADTDKDESIGIQFRNENENSPYTNSEIYSVLEKVLVENGYSVTNNNPNLVASLSIFKDKVYVGVSYIKHNVSDKMGGILYFQKNEEIVSRAQFKIEEAVKIFDVVLHDNQTALDLGAAPGGWTYFLAEKGLTVDAIDPAELSEKVLGHKNVSHFKMLSQNFIKNYPDKKYDMIVNDMKMDTNQSIDILCETSSQLKNDGICIMTLKLPKKDIQKRIKVAKLVLSRKFEIVKIRQLYYNRSEVTVYTKNKL